jgi:MraZ protein
MSKSTPDATLYSGAFRHTVDSKHRVTIPSRWRSDAGEEEFFAVPDPGGSFLMVMPPLEFDRVKTAVESNSTVSPADRRKFIRRFYALAQRVTVDKQGRVLLPEDYCRRLGLDGDVVLAGGHSRIEIWNAERWTAATAEQDEAFRRVAEEVGL